MSAPIARRRPCFGFALLASALLLLGHVCAVSPDVHADVVAAASPHHGPSNDDADALHVASCEATVSASTWAASVPLLLDHAGAIDSPVLRLDAPRWLVSRGSSTPAPPGAAPPLFLLHASFLI